MLGKGSNFFEESIDLGEESAYKGGAKFIPHFDGSFVEFVKPGFSFTHKYRELYEKEREKRLSFESDLKDCKKMVYDVKIIDLFALFDDEENFSKLRDEDAIQLCLLLSLEIWIIESSYVSDRWWTKVPKIIPKELSWRRKAEFNQYEFLGELFRKVLIELALTKDEVQCNWYAPSNDYFMWYVPRSPHVPIRGLYGEYLNKRSAARAAKKKSSEDFHPKFKRTYSQIKEYLQSTSEDEQDIKDHTSPKENGLCALDDNRKGWLLDKMKVCLEEKILVVLKEKGVFEKKSIDIAKYMVSFKVADGVPK
nr:hypothetical protein [Tanacetum cinerariifolium]